MSLYKSHSNPLSVHCAECHADITLQAQEIYDDKVLCSECYEFEGWEEYDDED